MKKLIPALAMLLIAAVMLGTSTYAWFSMNTTVTATGMSVTATTPVNLLISNVQGTSPWATYGSSATADETYTGKLYPASSNGAKVFNAIMNSGNYIGANGAGGVAENATTKFQKTSNQTDPTVVALTGGADGYWATYDFWVKLSEHQDAAKQVYLSDLKVAQTVTGDGTTHAPANTYYTDVACTSAVEEDAVLASATTYYVKGLTGAVRVALLAGGVDGTLKTIYANGNANASVNAVTATYPAADTAFTSGTDTTATSATKPTSGTTYAYNASYALDVNDTPVQFTLVVWIEGQDTNCVNANAGATVAIDFALDIYNA